MEINIPKDVLEAVNNVLDNRIKYPIKRLVRMDTKQDKIEHKVAVFSNSRIFILAARSPSKVEQSVHFFSIRGLESKKPNQLVISLDDDGRSNETKNLYFRTMEGETDEVNTMVAHVAVSLKQVFPGVAIERLIKTIDVAPASRLDAMYTSLKELELKDIGPCGGFTSMYNFMCDYHSLMQREEVTWDVDTIYLSNGTKELSLGDFDHLDNKDLTPIISSLRHNPWFTVINSSGTKLITDNMNELIKVMKKNKVIEELHLASVGVKFEFANRLSTALLSNSGSPLHTLDISGNQIEDRGIIHLASPLGKLSKGIVKLNLARCNLTPKGINRLAESLGSNKFTSSTLTTLCLAGNSLRGDDITSFCNFLAQPNAIVNLDLSDTECALDILCGALIRGCTQSLSDVNLSGNVFTNKKVKDICVPPSWKQFFAAAMSLEKVNLSNCKLPAEALKALITGIGTNRNIQELDLDISSNEFRSAGAHIIQGNIAEITNIASLDISDNGFDVELIGIVSWISKNKSIKKLSIGKNFSNIRARSSSFIKSSASTEEHVSQVLESVVQMIQEDDSPIQTLSLAGSKLKNDIALLINAMGSNTSLTKIDISGNNMGDYGARMLAKALQINTKLQTIYWDQNNTTAQGFHDVANALKNNYTLKYMPTPVCDASKCTNERAQAALEKIESLLHRNHSPRKFNSDKSFRLQHGFLISSSLQMVDRLVLQIQETIAALSKDPNTQTAAKVERAKQIIKDAENSKHLLLKLQEVALLSEEKGSMLDTTLATMTDDLKKVLEDQLERNLTDMLKSAEEQCPTVMEADEESKEEIMMACNEKSALPKNYVKGLIIHQVGTDMFNKMSEINLNVAAYMSDRITDTVLEQLTACHRSLVDCLNSMISSQPDVKVDESDNNEEIIKDKDAEITGEGDLLRLVLKASSSKYSEKRKSYLSRRVRPQSFVDPQFGDTDNDSHAVEKHVHEVVKEDKARKKPIVKVKQHDEADGERADVVLDLPALSSHQPSLGASTVTKGRPRATRTVRPSTRPPRPTPSNDEDRVDEGMDAFFESTKVDREFVQLPNKPEEDKPEKTKFEEVKPAKKTGKTNFFHKSKEPKEELSPPEKTETKEKSPAKAGGFSLGGLIGRKRSNKEVTKSASPAKDVTKKEEAVAEVSEKPDEEEAKEPERKPVSVPKMALPGMGKGLGGGNLMAEMARKREEREKREAKLETSGANSGNGKNSQEMKPRPVAALRSKDMADGEKPVPKPRPNSKRVSDGIDGKPAITKDKPALLPPKPAARAKKPSPAKEIPGEKVELRQSSEGGEEPKRLSIKDRIANLSKAPEHESHNEPSDSVPKSRSLPRGIQPNFAAMIGERPLSMYAKPAGDSSVITKKSRDSASPDEELDGDEELDRDEKEERVSSTGSHDSGEAEMKHEIDIQVKQEVTAIVTEKENVMKDSEDSEEDDIENNNERAEDKLKPEEEKPSAPTHKVDLFDENEDDATPV
ncbi:F-actin-uncapping protein LRRC16A-like isoform X4 [Lineus longissimus]|uniref:F-actin-uncapping protein LRRC16A-like isoform X4 n=1 Tax=Lineus longissimus TaxID=88925 RepID=UPI00315DF830